MGGIYIINAISANMLSKGCSPLLSAVTTAEANKLLVDHVRSAYDANWAVLGKDGPPEHIVNAIGHAETANIAASLLPGIPLAARVSLNLRDGDSAILVQYSGPRLPEGATTLPEGAKIDLYHVEVISTKKVMAAMQCVAVLKDLAYRMAGAPMDLEDIEEAMERVFPTPFAEAMEE